MAEQNTKTIYVYCDWENSEPVLMGELYVNNIRGKESFSFEYDENFLKGTKTHCYIDPDLNMYAGRQYPSLNKELFGIFSDSCPDRWGRLLMNRREAIFAKKEERKPRKLLESDYLLGVFDAARIGGIRFKLELDGDFVSSDEENATPPWVSLRELEAASVAFENDEDNNNKWLEQLLAPGSSLGGARPKATVQATDGSLWIAKFPSKHDEWNSGAWEMTVHDLAIMCGLDVPEAKLETFSKNGSTFLVKRFDRSGGKRIHFSSAMTLLGKTDGASGSDGSSYLEMASFIKSNGASPKEDLQELWRRIVFNIAVSNTDDHLRNHAFILSEKGWILSPLFDVNPTIYGDTLSLNISEDDNRMNFDLVQETAKYYGITESDAKNQIQEIKDMVANNWKTVAAKYKLSKSAIAYMEPAFDMKYK